jgi:hypothetical protein
MVRKKGGDVPRGGNTQCRIAEKKRMVRMDNTGVESPKNLGQFPGYGHGNRKVAAAEVMYCRKADHVRLILGSAFEEGGNYQNTIPLRSLLGDQILNHPVTEEKGGYAGKG